MPWLFATRKRSPLFLILGAIGAGLRDCPLLFALAFTSSDLRWSFQALVRHSQPDSQGGLKGLPASPSEGLPSPLYIHIVARSAEKVNW